MIHERINHPQLLKRLMSAEAAAEFIQPNDTVAMSGFTGSGYPKVVPQALANRITQLKDDGQKFKINVLTGASTAPELDGVLARINAMQLRLPYQSDPDTRKKINSGEIDYLDMHLSHVPQHADFGFYGDIDVAVIEIAGITRDGRLIPSTSLGNNKTWLRLAKKVILEVNTWQPMELEGMHDVHHGGALPPHREPIMICHTSDRIGEPYLRCEPEKIVAIVETHHPDRNSAFKELDGCSEQIAGHLMDFFDYQVKKGHLPKELLPIQSGVGNIANAVLHGLAKRGYKGLTAYTEVIQDSMMDLLDTGVLSFISATSFSLSPEANLKFKKNIHFYRDKIILRAQGISNHPEVIRRLGCLAMNGIIEADIYGNINSTHIMGSKIQNGIGGSGDFARNAYLSIFLTPSVAKEGAISSIVPMVSHVDHTEHDSSILVTDRGLADLRALSPKQRARLIINQCAHADYQAALMDYFDRACHSSLGQHTPLILPEALSWHQRWIDTGSMKIS